MSRTAIPLFRSLSKFDKLIPKLDEHIRSPYHISSLFNGFILRSKEMKQDEPKKEAREDQKGGGSQLPPEGLLEDFAKLDLRVGNIIECWKHPESEKLYCEKIDIGGEVREIGSGLQQFVPIGDMSGLVVVLVNLKPRKLGGFPSHGMVMCASNLDRTVIELLRPPASAKIGERITLEGYDLPPPSKEKPIDEKKFKITEKIFPYLCTNPDLEATYNGKRLLTSAGPIKAATLKGASIS